jgi:FkbM family methyltransferase
MSNNNKSFLRNIQIGILQNVKRLFLKPSKKVIADWLTIKYYKHLSDNGQLRVHKLFGKSLYFCCVAELLHGLKEIFDGHIYKQQLSDTPYIIDCGANIGMSIIYMKLQYPAAEILAFEPDENNFNLLQKNIASFGYNNVKVFKEAIWKENTTLLFSQESSMSSKIVIGGTNLKEVKAVRLRDYLQRNIDFLKIDIEGAEYEVLKDIANELHVVKNMFLEYHGTFLQNNELVEIIMIIKNAGFNFYIKEATSIYNTPFYRTNNTSNPYDVQLNIFCFRN